MDCQSPWMTSSPLYHREFGSCTLDAAPPCSSSTNSELWFLLTIVSRLYESIVNLDLLLLMIWFFIFVVAESGSRSIFKSNSWFVVSDFLLAVVGGCFLFYYHLLQHWLNIFQRFQSALPFFFILLFAWFGCKILPCAWFHIFLRSYP